MIGGTDVELVSDEKRSAATNEADNLTADEFNEPSNKGSINDDPPPEKKEEEWQGDFGFCRYKCMPADVECCGGFLRFNPIVTFMSIAIIWSFAGYCMADPAEAKLEINDWQTWIVDNFTWLYIGGVGAFFFFDLYLMCSRFGDVVLGEPGVPPRFSTASWFSMLFSAGIGIGLFFWGVSEPIYHYTDYNRWSKLPRYERAVAAMNVSWFHWGLAPSACYAIVGLPIAFLAHRNPDMNCSMRTVFYPLMKERVHGIIGDIIDISAVLGTMFGIATSLGLGVDTIGYGMARVFEDDSLSEIDSQKWMIWVITLFAAISVATGLDFGIKYLSEGNFLLGLFVLGFLLIAGDTFFLFSMFVEVTGNHLWYLLDLEFHTDAFLNNEKISGPDTSNWMGWWTVFYWGWWISWAPFVGVFIAQISKGRTVREFIMGNVFVPTLLTSAWFIIYGGLGLEMEMEAERLGIGGNQHILTGKTFGYLDAATITAATAGTATALTAADSMTMYGDEASYLYSNNSVAGVYTPMYAAGNTNMYAQTYNNYDYSYNQAVCAEGEPVGEGTLYRLSCRDHGDRLWDVIEHHSYGMFKFMGFITTVAVVTYFVTSSDSGSMVIDMLCSNGEAEPPLAQRLFWAISEGAVAFALLEAGGSDALSALQTASIAAGLPFLIIMILMMVSTYTMFLDMEKEDPEWQATQAAQIKEKQGDKHEPVEWTRRLLEYADIAIMDSISFGPNCMPSLTNLLIAIVAPPVILYRTGARTNLNQGMCPTWGWCTLFWILFPVCHILELAERGFWAFGWLSYMAFAVLAAGQRGKFRETYNLAGDGLSDCCSVFFCYPCALLQVENESVELTSKE